MKVLRKEPLGASTTLVDIPQSEICGFCGPEVDIGPEEVSITVSAKNGHGYYVIVMSLEEYLDLGRQLRERESCCAYDHCGY